MPPATFGPFEILEVLGSGGMGVVYRARDSRLHREVALKVLRPDVPWAADARDHLLREARAISALSHPHICTVHDIGELDGQAFIVMELVPGTPLALRLTRQGLDAETVARWGAQLADALDHAHQQGVIHRDIKPSNVVVTPSGQVKLVDFGVAGRAIEAHEPTVVETGAAAPRVAGTLPYMAPEVIRGAIADPRSDVWSLGVVLHEALSGSKPFAATGQHDVATAILHAPPADLPSRVPRQLATIVRRCLSKDPAARYQRVGEVRAALDALQLQGVARPAVILRPAWMLAALALAGIVFVTAGLPGARRLTGWLAVDRAATADPAPLVRGLAVLPLRNIGGDPGQDFFAEGMTSALITELAKVERLKVISQTSVMRYRAGIDRSLPQIAAELGVDTVLEGSVLRVGDQVRISVDLVHAATDRHLWAESYERPLQDVLALQRDIARAVVARVESRMLAGGDGRTHARVNPAAYEMFLRGEISVAQGNPIAVSRAVEYYGQAIAIDPTFAPAHAGLAGAIFAQEFWGDAAFASNVARIREITETALRLDPGLADAHVMLARIYYNYDWKFEEAVRSLQRAISLSPGLAFAHETYCWVLLSLGRRDEAIAEARTATALSPRSAYMLFTEGRVLHRARDFAAAERRYQETIALDPGFVPPYLTLIQLYVTQRRFDDAREVLTARDRLPSARRQDWMRVLIDTASSGGAPPAAAVAGLPARDRARVYSLLGRQDEALTELERAVAERRFLSAQLTDPELDFVRGDPRFRRIVERIGLPPDPLVAWGTRPGAR
jgi:TolB-like protein/tetratricopeptide (TPR) repeat protein